MSLTIEKPSGGVFLLNKDKEGPEERRERLRQEELKRNPAGGIHGGGLQDCA